MIELFCGLVCLEAAVIIALLFKTPLRPPLVTALGLLKRGRGPLIAKTVFGTLFMMLLGIFYDISTLKTTNHILRAYYLLEASFLGFSLFLAMVVERIHYYLPRMDTAEEKLDYFSKKNINSSLPN
ncbi:unnamed protein product [Cuscuta epithymum]|uniref:Endoplasmic reticulum transmembrane protein n=1 Tax=Cuscuta epithymum TaxID=186058 RepID=A0AAV0FUD1_9ASTE|nr:unnamed protein product [Cuscuta epithymum]